MKRAEVESLEKENDLADLRKAIVEIADAAGLQNTDEDDSSISGALGLGS